MRKLLPVASTLALFVSLPQAAEPPESIHFSAARRFQELADFKPIKIDAKFKADRHRGGRANDACFLIDEKANAAGVGGTDLGIPIATQGDKFWFAFGDVNGPEGQIAVGGSAVLEATTPFACNQTSWKLDGNGRFYEPLTSKRRPGDESTVPAGGIEVSGTLYLYAMQVDHWGDDSRPGDPTNVHGALFKQGGTGFAHVLSWPMNQKHGNTAPVWGELDGQQAIFMAITGSYRASPVYLAHVRPQDIENKAAYRYFTGHDRNKRPTWSSDIDHAVPLNGMDNVGVGELSLVKNDALGKYYMMFQSYGGDRGYMLFSAEQPYGPWSQPTRFSPCGNNNNASWMPPGWKWCYGGYIIPNNFGDDGKDIYYTISVWVPYSTIVLKMRGS